MKNDLSVEFLWEILPFCAVNCFCIGQNAIILSHFICSLTLNIFYLSYLWLREPVWIRWLSLCYIRPFSLQENERCEHQIFVSQCLEFRSRNILLWHTDHFYVAIRRQLLQWQVLWCQSFYVYANSVLEHSVCALHYFCVLRTCWLIS